MIGTTIRLILLVLVAAAATHQVWRVRRFWAFLFVFIVLFPKIGLAAVPGNPTPIRIDDLLLGVVIAGWLIREALVGGRDTFPTSPVTPFLITYLFCAATSTLLGVAALRLTWTTGALHFLRIVEYVSLYYYFYRAIRPSELTAFKELFVNTWLIVAGIWIAQHVVGATVVPPPGTLIDQSSYAPSFSASYDFGGYAMIATAVCYGLWTDRRTRDWLITAGLLAGLYIVFNGDSRAAFLGLAAAIGFDLFLRLRVKVALGILGVAAALPYLVSSKKMARLFDAIGEIVTSMDPATVQRTFFNDPSIEMRLRNWQVALERWRDSPLLGDGLGAFLQYVRIYDMQGTPDGWYIRMLAEVGLVGLLAFVMTIGCLLWVLLGAYQHLEAPLPRAIVYAAALTVIATATDALLIDAFVSYKIMGVFWMVMAVGTLVAVRRPRAGEAPAPMLAPPLGSPLPGGAR
jgi:O-antigen ligase